MATAALASATGTMFVREISLEITHVTLTFGRRMPRGRFAAETSCGTAIL